MKKFFVLFIMLIVFQHYSYSQNRTIDSLQRLLKTDKEDTIKVIHLNTLAQELMYNNPDTSIILDNQALLIAEKLSASPNKALARAVKEDVANSLGSLGIYYYFKSDYPTAIDYYLKALKIDEELKNKSGMARHLGNLGIVYEDQAYYLKALEYYLKALKIGEELGDKKRIASQLSNIGVIYLHQNDYPKALEYYFKALKIENELGNKNGNVYNLGLIGGVYNAQASRMQNSDKIKSDSLYLIALDYYFKALKQAEELENKNLIAAWLCNIGNVYSHQGNFGTALTYHLKYLKLAEEIGNKNYQAIGLGNIGSNYASIGKYNEAFNYLYRALAIDNSIKVMDNVKSWYEQLSFLYETSTIPLQDTVGGKMLSKEGMRLRALYYYKRSVAVRDTIFSEENKKQLIRKEMNYDFEKKEITAKAEQNIKDAHAAEEKQKQQLVLFFVIGGLVLVMVFSGFLYKRFRVTQKQKRIIERQKQLVEQHQQEIIDSITYAKRIQKAHLPTEKYISKNIDRLKS